MRLFCLYSLHMCDSQALQDSRDNQVSWPVQEWLWGAHTREEVQHKCAA